MFNIKDTCGDPAGLYTVTSLLLMYRTNQHSDRINIQKYLGASLSNEVESGYTSKLNLCSQLDFFNRLQNKSVFLMQKERPLIFYRGNNQRLVDSLNKFTFAPPINFQRISNFRSKLSRENKKSLISFVFLKSLFSQRIGRDKILFTKKY